MLLRNIRNVLRLMAHEPRLAPKLPVIKRRVRITALLTLLSEVVFVVELLPVKFFVDEIAKDEPQMDRLIAIALSFVVIYKVGQSLRKKLSISRNDFFWGSFALWWGHGHTAVLRQSTDWHVSNSTGEKESLVGKNISKFEGLFDEMLFTTIPVAVRIMFTTIFMFFIHWSFGLVAILVSLFYALVLRSTERHLTSTRQEFQERMKELENIGSELNRTWQTIRSLGMEEEFAAANQEKLDKFWYDEWPRHRKFMKYIFRQEDVIIYSRAVLYAVAGLLAFEGQVGLGSVVLATSWMEKAFSNYGRFEQFQRQLNIGKEALRELVEFIQLPVSVTNPDKPMLNDEPRGQISLVEVSFVYGDGAEDEPALCAISLEIPAYSSVALVGSSGCGKSTLAKLLAREYDPTRGSVRIDGIDLRHYDHKWLRNQMLSVVAQDVHLFDRNILENIRIGRPNASYEEVVEAARAAEAHDFIVSTPNGYATMIGENGLKLSGGQRQRLAIARALLMNSRVLILDEATSALDAISQAGVQQTLEKLMRQKTCTIVIIAHRLSTVMIADKVVVMDKGRIIGQGTHKELVASNDHYRQLCKLELGNF